MIKVTNLTKKYGKHTAVNGISFEVEDGAVVGFLGPNGAGKSTTMNMLCGYISSTDGEILIDGHDILNDPIRAKKCIGYLPEHPPLYSDMLVSEYLNFAYELKKVKGKTKQERQAHIDEIMEKTGLMHVKDRVIRNLSKGYQQRVGFAQALIGDPKVLILDEPTVGLDPNQIVEIRNLIKELGEKHTVILSSHILPEISAVCSKVIIINKGEIIAQDTTENLLSNTGKGNTVELEVMGEQVLKFLQSRTYIANVKQLSETEESERYEIAFTTKDSNAVVMRLSADLAKAGIAVLELKRRTESLEEVFTKLTMEEDR